jgi:hypothetical protein
VWRPELIAANAALTVEYVAVVTPVTVTCEKSDTVQKQSKAVTSCICFFILGYVMLYKVPL